MIKYKTRFLYVGTVQEDSDETRQCAQGKCWKVTPKVLFN